MTQLEFELDFSHSEKEIAHYILNEGEKVLNLSIKGLRHIDEVIEYFGFQNGERLGHATVLGLSLDDYTNTHQIITLPAIELLDNWLWLHRLKSKYNLFKDI